MKVEAGAGAAPRTRKPGQSVHAGFQQESGDPTQRTCFPWASRDLPNFLARTPSRGRSQLLWKHIMDVNNYIPFSLMSSQTIDVM